MTERVLVLGGGGFLGRHLVRDLAASGRRVRAFDLRIPTTDPPAEGVEFVAGSIFNDADLEVALTDVDTVFHLVSTTVPSSSLKSSLVEVEGNVAATARLLDVMTRLGVRRLGYPSSGGTVYGPTSQPHREDEPLRPTSPYGLGKVMIEEMIRFFGAERGLDYQIWRLANPYGDTAKLHTSQGVIDAFLQRIRMEQPIQVWGEGAAVRDYVFVDDAVRAIRMLSDGDAWNTTVNVGTGVGRSIAEVIDTIRAEIGVPFTVRREEAYTGPSTSILDVTRLRELVGWEPEYDLARGIRESWGRFGGSSTVAKG